MFSNRLGTGCIYRIFKFAQWSIPKNSLGLVELVFEYINLDSVNMVSSDDEKGYNTRLLFDFDPMALFIGYGEWAPNYTTLSDPDDPSISYAVEQLNRVTVGGGYVIGDYLQIKLEYLSHLDTTTGEPDFEKRKLTFQLVASF